MTLPSPPAPLRLQLILLSGLLMFTAAGASPYYKTESKCSTGEIKRVDCNLCVCNSAGEFLCTTEDCTSNELSCQYGRMFIDQCENRCTCVLGGGYSCTEKACVNGTPGRPMTCEVNGDIRVTGSSRLSCKRGIVQIDSSSRCAPGTIWREHCNTCSCTRSGKIACTEQLCSTQDQGPFHCAGNGDCRPQPGKKEPEPPILDNGGGGGGGGGQQLPDIPVKLYCDGLCPSDCGEVLDESRQCYKCQCLPELQFGDVVVPANDPCPSGLLQGPTLFATKICRGQGCTPGAKWRVFHDGCSRCVCTADGEPACTPCQRGQSASTVTCDQGHKECPQDCGQTYNPSKDCFDCPCGVGEPGDIHVQFGEPCPPGTDWRASGAFFQACGPIDTLPKGDTTICDIQECPADCGTVRISRQENCAYCQCGPELAPGDEVVPLYQECPPPKLPGPTQLATKVCRAPTREECVPESTYNIKCDICLCQEDGVPACTLRDCSLAKYGNLQACDSQYRECPADCGTAGTDNYCRYCQCGPRLDKGDITVPIDHECPPGFVFKENDFVTTTCAPASPEGGSKQYCDGECPADCGEVLDSANNCYRCQCGPKLQFGDVVVAVDSPCPAGLHEGQRLFATKVCRAQRCTPGAKWRVHHDGCSRCVCTANRDPACTPCQRGPSESTLTCEDGHKRCPQDCGKTYNPSKDCFDCPCGVGETGDIHVPFEQPCPPGTDWRDSGAFTKACGPIDTLPKGDTKICDIQECPADCGTVRTSRKENCAYCQCGPELAPGDEVVPLYQECPSPKLPGPTQLATKVCRAPTREECLPETEYYLKCDLCLCQEDGVPACTLRDCTPPIVNNSAPTHQSSSSSEEDEDEHGRPHGYPGSNQESSSEEDSSEEKY